MVHVYHFSVDAAAAAPAAPAALAAVASAAASAAGGAASPAAPPAPAPLLGPTAGGPASPHGDPFFVRIADHETLADVKPRIRARLRGASGASGGSGGSGTGGNGKRKDTSGVSDKEWASWKFALCFGSNRAPEYLEDGDVISARLPAKQARGCNQGNDTCFLGLEHAAGAGGGRARGAARRGAGGGGGFEKAIKIH